MFFIHSQNGFVNKSNGWFDLVTAHNFGTKFTLTSRRKDNDSYTAVYFDVDTGLKHSTSSRSDFT